MRIVKQRREDISFGFFLGITSKYIKFRFWKNEFTIFWKTDNWRQNEIDVPNIRTQALPALPASNRRS